MPYVEGFGTWPFGEEWLWEAVACVYLPLLDVLDGAPVTLGLTPVLCDQLEAMRGDAGERYLRFLREVRAPIHAEDAAGLDDGGEPRARGRGAPRRRATTRAPTRPSRRAAATSVGAFAALDGVELWTSAATHGLLPLLATDAGLRLQVATGTASHMRRFGDWGGGFWLPECAYDPGLERELADHGVRAFCVDQTRRGRARPPEPVATDAGAVAVPMDWQTVELVWCEERGYPAHGGYRDYYRRTVHDLRPWSNAGEPYDHDAALELARAHARDFVAACRREARRAAASLCCALDTELLGHWWYEGLDWLRRGARGGARPGLTGDGVRGGRAGRAGRRGSWRRPPGAADKDFTTWDAPAVAELAFDARARGARDGGGGGDRTAARTPRWSAPPASCWPSSRATGRSWSRATWPPTTRSSACGPTRLSTPRWPL